MPNPHPKAGSHYGITDEGVIPLVCSLIGVPETVMTNVIKDIEKTPKKPILRKKIPRKPSTKNTSFDCLVIKNLIQIEKQNGPKRIPSLDYYKEKLKEKVSYNFSRDQIKNWLNIIGLKWTNESTPKSEEIHTEKIYTEEICKPKMTKKPVTKNTSFDCLVIKHLIQIETQTGPDQIPTLDHYMEKLNQRLANNFSRDQIKELLKVIGLQWMDESEEIYTEENTESQSSSEDVEMQENTMTLNTEDYSLEDIKLIDPEIEIKTETEEDFVESSSELEDEIEIKTERELNYPEPTTSQEHFVEESSSELEDEIEIKSENEFNYSEPTILQENVVEESNSELEDEIEIKSELNDSEPTILQFAEESSSVLKDVIEIKSESELNDSEPTILQFADESSSELEDEIEIKTESETNYSEPTIVQELTEDINVKLETDKEFNKIHIKTEFCDFEDALQPHVILRKPEEHFVEDLTSDIEDEIKPEVTMEVQTETEPESAIVQDFVSDINIKLEEEFNETHMKTDSQQSDFIHIKNEFTCAEEEVQLEFVDVDGSADDLHNIIDTVNYIDKTERDFPTLDYFVSQLSLHYSNYPKSLVAKWLKKVEIRFKDDHKINTTTEHLVNDPAIPRFLKQFNLLFYFNKETTVIEDNNLETRIDDLSDSIDPKIEEIITEIGISCHKQGVIPSFTMFLCKVQSYDKNIDIETLEEWLKKLKVTYRRDHIPLSQKIKKPFECKIPFDSTDKIPFDCRDKIPFEYFYNHISLTRYKCSKNTLKKWLELLKINYARDTYDPELTGGKTKAKIYPAVVKILLQLEKSFYNKKQLRNPPKANRTRETKDAEEIETNTDIEKMVNISTPTLDYFYSKLKVCCKHTLKKWLEFLNINFGLHNCEMESECNEQYLLPDLPTIRLIKQLNTDFYIHFYKLPVPPKEADHTVLWPIVQELYTHFKGTDEILTLDVIYDYVISSSYFDTNVTCSKKQLKEWLIARKIRFREEDNDNSKKTPKFFYDSLQLPTLDYFYKNINKDQYICCKSTMKKWLDCLTIKYEPENIIEPKHKRSEAQLSSTTIIQHLIKLEEQFNKNKILSLMLIESLTSIAKEHKNRSKIPSLDVFHQYVVNSKLFKPNQGYNKESLKWVLKHLKITYKTSERDELNVPTLDYFYEKLKAKGVHNISYTQVKIWLIQLKIKFENNRKSDENVEMINLTDCVTKLLQEIDLEFRVKQLIIHLKNRDKSMNNKRWKPPSFKKILNIIDKYDLFDADLHADYKKSVLKKWVQKLGIRFLDEEQKEPKESVPPLDYFYKKLTQFEGNVCTKDTLAQWLCQIRVQFKEKRSITQTNKHNDIPSNIINTLWKLSKFYHMSDVEPIFKKLFQAFDSRNQAPSLEYIQKKLFELKGFHKNKRDLKQWLDFVGIKYQNKRYRDDIENEIDKKIKKKYKSLLLDTEEVRTETEERTQILEINDSSTDSNTEMFTEEKLTEVLSTAVLNINNSKFVKNNVLEEAKLTSKSHIIEIEENSIDSNTERTDLTQHTEIIEIDDDDDIPVSEQYEEQLLDIQPSTSNNQQISIPIDDPLLVLDSNQTTSQQPEIPITLNEPSKNLQKQRKPSKQLHSKSIPDETKKNSEPEQRKSSNQLQTKSIPVGTIIRIRKKNLPPDDVMKLLTDVEYNYYKMKKTPTLDQFNDAVVKTFGNRYSKEMLQVWLKKAGIRFRIPESFYLQS